MPKYTISVSPGLLSMVDASDVLADGNWLAFTVRPVSAKPLKGHIIVGTLVGEAAVVPHGDIVSGAVTALREQQAEVRSKAAAEVTALEGRIQSLLCLENQA